MTGPAISGPRLGLIAGGGQAPFRLIEALQEMGRPFFVVCLEGQADEDLAKDLPHAWLSLGSVAKFKQIVQEQQIGEIVFLGRVRRPSLKELKPDFLAIKLLAKIGMNGLGDDALLKAVGKTLEQETGARVIGAHEVFGELLMPTGVLTKTQPDEIALADLKRGAEMARELGRLDIGQAVVVQQGLILGVEAIEGTDALIARAGSLQREGERGLLVKMAKPQQDCRFDLPSIGPQTVAAVTSAGLRGIGVEAGRSLLIDRAKTLALADEAGIFIVGLESR